MGKNISETLKQALGYKTQKWLAEATELTEATICRYVKGERTPNAKNLEKIAKALNVSVDYLLGNVGKMEHDGCVGCLYELEPEESTHCTGCTQNAIDKYKPMTNGDRIRRMSDEELAERINEIDCCVIVSGHCRHKECIECVKIWLKEKVE